MNRPADRTPASRKAIRRMGSAFAPRGPRAGG